MANNNLSRVIWRVSLPIILVEATETIDHLINTVFLARVGVTELGAIAVADAVLLLFLVLPLSLVDGMQILTARRVGQRKPAAVGAAFNQGFMLVVLICIGRFRPLAARLKRSRAGNHSAQSRLPGIAFAHAACRHSQKLFSPGSIQSVFSV